MVRFYVRGDITPEMFEYLESHNVDVQVEDGSFVLDMEPATQDLVDSYLSSKGLEVSVVEEL